MANKGTQALLMSDISVIRSVLDDNVVLYVSTVDVEGANRLDLPVDAVLPPLVDIPYERADRFAKRYGCDRSSLKYRMFAGASLGVMLFQIVSVVFSSFLAKIGLKPFYRAEVLERMRGSDLVVSCSDENFKESSPLFPSSAYWIVAWWSMLIPRTVTVLAARYLGRPVVVFPNSIGPFRTWLGRFVSRLALNRCERVLVRESISFDLAKSLGVTVPRVLTSDTALLFKSECASALDDFAGPAVAVCAGVYSKALSEDGIRAYVEAHACALDGFVERNDVNVVFLPHYVSGFRYDDLEVSRLVLGKMRNKAGAKIINVKTACEFKALIDRVDLVVSSKMHPAVLAASSYVPTLYVAYDSKQVGFFMSLGMNDCIVSINELSSEKLLSKLEYVWNRRQTLRTLLESRVPVLQNQTMDAIASTLATFAGEKLGRRKVD
jgi:colanic acid/amylovoran biosynthesis protein